MSNSLLKHGPEDFNTHEHYWNAFGNSETEVSARWLVRFCQKRGDWGPFPLDDLQAFYEEGRGRPEVFCFNRLTTDVHTHWGAAGRSQVSHTQTVRVEGGTVTILPEFVGALIAAGGILKGTER